MAKVDQTANDPSEVARETYARSQTATVMMAIFMGLCHSICGSKFREIVFTRRHYIFLPLYGWLFGVWAALPGERKRA
jgi:hypothetical protein